MIVGCNGGGGVGAETGLLKDLNAFTDFLSPHHGGHLTFDGGEEGSKEKTEIKVGSGRVVGVLGEEGNHNEKW